MKKRYSLSDYSPEQVQAARETVANWYAETTRAIRREDEYAGHVTKQQKDDNLTFYAGPERAERILKP